MLGAPSCGSLGLAGANWLTCAGGLAGISVRAGWVGVVAKDALPGPAVDCHSGLDCASSRGVMGILGGGGLAASGYGLGWAGLQGAGPRDSRGAASWRSRVV